MNFFDAIVKVLVSEGKFAERFAITLANQIIDDAKRLGLPKPTFNLVWSVISKETLVKKSYAQELAEYIIELNDKGNYTNKSQEEIDRIITILNPKN